MGVLNFLSRTLMATMGFAVSLCLVMFLAEHVHAATEHEATLGSLFHDIAEIEMGLEGTQGPWFKEVKGTVERFKTQYNWLGVKLMRAGVPYAVVENAEKGFKVMETCTAIQEQVLDKADDAVSMINALTEFWPTLSKTISTMFALLEVSNNVASNALEKACEVPEDASVEGSVQSRSIFLKVQFPLNIKLMLERLQKDVSKGKAELSADATAKLDALVPKAQGFMKTIDTVKAWLQQA